MHIPNPGYPPSSSAIAPPLRGYIHSLSRVVGEALENERQQITGDNEDEGIGGMEGKGKKEGGRRFALRVAIQFAPWLAPATPTQ
eukprot:2562946-Pyramimonas_sp.AAC.1